MRPFLALVAGFVVSLGMFAGGLAFATYLLTAEPVHQPDPGQDVAKLWTEEPRTVSTSAQDLERLPALADPPRPEASDEERAASEGTGTMGGLAPDSGGTIVTGAVQDAEDEHRRQPMPTEGLSEAHIEWCADRYRSYRPRDDSYTPYSGGRRRCVSPFSKGIEVEADDVPPPASDSIIHAESADPSAPSVEWVSADPIGSDLAGAEHAAYCFSRYRSYRPEDNTYQPYGGGPRRQCRFDG